MFSNFRAGGWFPMAPGKNKSPFRAFLDYFILFSGVSTASNLARTQGRPLKMLGIFLIRPTARD